MSIPHECVTTRHALKCMNANEKNANDPIPPLNVPREVLQDVMTNIARQLLAVGVMIPPRQFRGWLSGVFANTLGAIPDDHFEKMLEIKPCGTEGCDCHITMAPRIVEYFTFIRDDWKASMAKQEERERAREV